MLSDALYQKISQEASETLQTQKALKRATTDFLKQIKASKLSFSRQNSKAGQVLDTVIKFAYLRYLLPKIDLQSDEPESSLIKRLDYQIWESFHEKNYPLSLYFLRVVGGKLTEISGQILAVKGFHLSGKYLVSYKAETLDKVFEQVNAGLGDALNESISARLAAESIKTGSKATSVSSARRSHLYFGTREELSEKEKKAILLLFREVRGSGEGFEGYFGDQSQKLNERERRLLKAVGEYEKVLRRLQEYLSVVIKVEKGMGRLLDENGRLVEKEQKGGKLVDWLELQTDGVKREVLGYLGELRRSFYGGGEVDEARNGHIEVSEVLELIFKFVEEVGAEEGGGGSEKLLATKESVMQKVRVFEDEVTAYNKLGVTEILPGGQEPSEGSEETFGLISNLLELFLTFNNQFLKVGEEFSGKAVLRNLRDFQGDYVVGIDLPLHELLDKHSFVRLGPLGEPGITEYQNQRILAEVVDLVFRGRHEYTKGYLGGAGESSEAKEDAKPAELGVLGDQVSAQF